MGSRYISTDGIVHDLPATHPGRMGSWIRRQGGPPSLCKAVFPKICLESYLWLMTERTVKQLTDPRALRALAHPTRLALAGLLRRDGPLTATRAGELLGQSSASASFHLRQLAKYGLVEEAGGRPGREQPWRAPPLFTNRP